MAAAEIEVRRCSSCRQGHTVQGEPELLANGWWVEYVCPTTNKATKSRTKDPKKPRKQANKRAPATREKPMRKWTIKLDAQNVVDLDDSELWDVADGLITGLREETGVADARATRLAEAIEKHRRYRAGGKEHGDKDDPQAGQRFELGRQLAPVLVDLMLAEGLSWQMIRPPRAGRQEHRRDHQRRQRANTGGHRRSADPRRHRPDLAQRGPGRSHVAGSRHRRAPGRCGRCRGPSGGSPGIPAPGRCCGCWRRRLTFRARPGRAPPPWK